MQAKWLSDCKTDEDRRKRKEALLGSQLILDILSKVCYNSTIQDKSENDYDNPNWAYKQADLVGYKRAMNEIIKMCNLKDH